MKVTRYRHHKINPAEKSYESLNFGAGVEFDTEVDELPEEYKEGELNVYLNDFLDGQLDPEIERVVKSGTSIPDSHIFDYYEID